MGLSQLSAQALLTDAVEAGVLEDMTEKKIDANKVFKEEIKFLEDFGWDLLSVAVRCRDYQLVRMFDKLQHLIDQKIIQETSK